MSYQGGFTPFLPSILAVPEEPDRLKVFLIDEFIDIIDAVNARKIGVYSVSENINGEIWEYGTDTSLIRNGFQIIVDVPVLPNAGALVLTNGVDYTVERIDERFRMTQCYGTATRPATAPGMGDYFTFVGQGDPRITLQITDQNIILTSTVDLTAYQAFIVMEYIRNN